jgi:predicted dithiol-disulfide oxidoreductase (DUF899 family)
MDDPLIVSRDEWLAARKQLLAREKEFTRQRDALNAERRKLPMTEIGKQYLFEGKNGKASLLDLFESRGQLLIYHFMFDPNWDEGCPTCSLLTDNIGHLAHLHARDTSLALVSRATGASPNSARSGRAGRARCSAPALSFATATVSSTRTLATRAAATCSTAHTTGST